MMDFGKALGALKEGKRVARSGWNGKGMFIFLVPGSNFLVNREPLASIVGMGAEITYRPHIDMKDAEGKVVPWLASQTDVLADDWGVVALASNGDAVEMPGGADEKILRKVMARATEVSDLTNLVLRQMAANPPTADGRIVIKRPNPFPDA